MCKLDPYLKFCCTDGKQVIHFTVLTYQSSGLEKTGIGATPARTNQIGNNKKKKKKKGLYVPKNKGNEGTMYKDT
jgi:hypothetical protein